MFRYLRSAHTSRKQWLGDESGVSLIEALVSVGILGVLALGFSSVFGGSFKQYRMNKERQERSNLSNYFLQHVDCYVTASDPNFEEACQNNQPVDVRDSQNNVILPASGRTFDDYLSVTNTCSDGALFFTARTIKDATPKSMMGGVPIVCKTIPTVCSSISADRLPSPNQTSCLVEIKKNESVSVIPSVLIRGAVNTTGVWSSDGMTWTGNVPCDAAGASISGALRTTVGDYACGEALVEPVTMSSCDVGAKRVGIWGDLTCSRAHCNVWREATLKRGIVLPADATNIRFNATWGFVDDWSPHIYINGNQLTAIKEGPKYPRWFAINKDISAMIKPGDNAVYVGSYNLHTYWSNFLTVRGSYDSASGCNHEFRFFDRGTWRSN